MTSPQRKPDPWNHSVSNTQNGCCTLLGPQFMVCSFGYEDASVFPSSCVNIKHESTGNLGTTSAHPRATSSPAGALTRCRLPHPGPQLYCHQHRKAVSIKNDRDSPVYHGIQTKTPKTNTAKIHGFNMFRPH